MTVLSATTWRDNAQLIAEAIVPLGYIKRSDRVIDLTYGGGKWWTQYRHPQELFIACVETHQQLVKAMDDDEQLGCCRVVPNYRYLEVHSNGYREKFDVCVFDPPYVSMGGRDTSTIPDFVGRYGLRAAARTPQLLLEDNLAALLEITKITEPGGLILAKSCNYVSSGKLFPGTHLMFAGAMDLGLTYVDEFTHVGHIRSQPTTTRCKACGWGIYPSWSPDPRLTQLIMCPACDGRGTVPRQVEHARQNASTLFVFRNGRKPRRRKSCPAGTP